MPERTVSAAACLTAVAGVVVAVAVGRADGGALPAPEAAPERLTVTSTSAVGTVWPGGAVTGVLRIENRGAEPVRVRDVSFTPAVSDTCGRTGLVLAPTVAPTPESPVEVPARGTADLGWTGYMDGTGDETCQGATLTSELLLDGQPAGTVDVTAGALLPPAAPTGGATTSTRAAVRWSASTAVAPGWVLERTVAGTADWRPACGSSARQPLRTPACTDTGLAAATAYVYRVTLRTGQWQATSRASRPVTTQPRPGA